MAVREYEQARYSYEAQLARVGRLQQGVKLMKDGPGTERKLASKAEMEAACARWALMVWGGCVHAFTDVGVNVPGVAVHDEPVTRHAYALAHSFISDAFAGKL